MHVRVIGQCPGPGVQNRQDPDAPTHVMGVCGQLDQRLGRRRNPCLACGYDLTGNVSGRCSECGAVRKRSGRVSTE
jgi:hypothetical protein